MIPYPFMNSLNKMREGERRYGHRTLENSSLLCNQCHSTIKNSWEYSAHLVSNHGYTDVGASIAAEKAAKE